MWAQKWDFERAFGGIKKQKIVQIAGHCFCVSQIVTPVFDTHSNNSLFGRGVLLFGNSKNSQFYLFLCFNGFLFWKPPKTRKWPEQVCAPKILFCESPKTVSFIPLKIHFWQIQPSFPTTPKNIFSEDFWIFCFVSPFSVWLSTTLKNRKHNFSFAPSHTIGMFKVPQTIINIGGNKQTFGSENAEERKSKTKLK